MHRQHVIAAQAGVATREQLRACGIDADAVRHRVRRGRWQTVGSTVVITTSGPLSVEQRHWVAVLHVCPGAPLAGVTACTAQGLRNWNRDEIVVLARKSAGVNAELPGVRVRRTRRSLDDLVSSRPGPPMLRIEPAALLHASVCSSEREAHGLLAACIQQRLTTVERVSAELAALSPLRRAESLRRCLGDIADGAGSRAEMDVTAMCRDHGIVEPARQVRRRDSSGRFRFTDCEWHLPDGSIVVLEVDGGFHMDVEHWEADIRRSRGIVDPRIRLVRATTRELRDESWIVAADLRRLGVPRRLGPPGRPDEDGA